MTEEANQPDHAHHTARVAGGAGYAFLGRLGALIEVGSVIAFTWVYGSATFGLFAVLWSYVRVATTVTDLGMGMSLQRFIPRAGEAEASRITGTALKSSFLASCLIALVTTLLAPMIAPHLNAAKADEAHLISVIRLYVWVLPFWTFVEVATAAIRARRTFGPEIKVRIFYEQGLRLIVAVSLGLLGARTYGLFAAHLVSVILAALLALRLIARYYDLSAVLKAPITGATTKELRTTGLSLMPATITKKLFSEFPVMVLNFMLPGAAGAAAGGYYAVARKVASALQVVRTTFEYVMAPLAAERAGEGDHKALSAMYAYATRLSLTFALPFGAALVLARHDILATMRPEFQAAAAAIAILCLGRVIEAATGPSSAIIETLGHRLLAALNGLAGIVALLIVSALMIPAHGVTGAAIAAAVGLNVTALLSLIEAAALFRLWPYDRGTLRPLALSALLSAGMIALIPASNHWPAPYGLIAALLGLMLTLGLVVRHGLTDTDATALGKLGRLIRPQPSGD
ncbi:lipopolysaccharide biosynthesis protein [Kordiimonas marina]|uniref:lipopolysaccharide biosynthesis protein n=1 Tax=Kordiimonas marina TaxID=2872312 RepID=UPI001FF2CC2F|nr:lipopolysaccharide biosynthesis protein [Kordiimonas marina]MCJ9430192.1 lipopolysaccharide biosynthesis protein [Kordiimonas marina]